MPLDASHCQATYKALVLGDFSVGKTALLKTLTGGRFEGTHRPTVGVDFVSKIFEVDGALVQLAIWDSAGQERFRSITRQQYRGVQGLILVYDVTDQKSFETLKYWVKSIQEEISPVGRGYEPVPVVVVANKADLDGRRAVSQAQGIKFSNKEMAFGFFETSAKTGQNVFEAFHTLAFHITDIHDPRIMKSYHPYSIRPLSQHNDQQAKQADQKNPKKKKNRRLKFRKSKGNKNDKNVRQDSDGVVSLDFKSNTAWYTSDGSGLRGEKQLSSTQQNSNNRDGSKHAMKTDKKIWKNAIRMCRCFGGKRMSVDDT